MEWMRMKVLDMVHGVKDKLVAACWGRDSPMGPVGGT